MPSRSTQELIDRLENHEFEPIKTVQWRARAARFLEVSTPCAIACGPSRATGACLRAPVAATTSMPWKRSPATPRSSNCAIARRTSKQLWEICQIPDYRKISSQNHAELVASVFKDSSGVQQRAHRRGLVRKAGRVRGPDGRRHRHALEPAVPHPDLDVRRKPAGLAAGSGTLAGPHPRNRRQPLRCPARLPDAAFRRRARQRA